MVSVVRCLEVTVVLRFISENSIRNHPDMNLITVRCLEVSIVRSVR